MDLLDAISGDRVQVNGKDFRQGPDGNLYQVGRAERVGRSFFGWVVGNGASSAEHIRHQPVAVVREAPRPPANDEGYQLMKGAASLAWRGLQNVARGTTTVVTGAYSLARAQVVWTEAYVEKHSIKLTDNVIKFIQSRSSDTDTEAEMRAISGFLQEAQRLVKGAESNPAEINGGLVQNLNTLITEKIQPLFDTIWEKFELQFREELVELRGQVEESSGKPDVLQNCLLIVRDWRDRLADANPASDGSRLAQEGEDLEASILKFMYECKQRPAAPAALEEPEEVPVVAAPAPVAAPAAAAGPWVQLRDLRLEQERIQNDEAQGPASKQQALILLECQVGKLVSELTELLTLAGELKQSIGVAAIAAAPPRQ